MILPNKNEFWNSFLSKLKWVTTPYSNIVVNFTKYCVDERPNGLRFSRAASFDREMLSADTAFQKRTILLDAQRRRLHALVGRVPRLSGTALHLSSLPHGTRIAQRALPATRCRTGLGLHNRRCLGSPPHGTRLHLTGVPHHGPRDWLAQRAFSTTGLGTHWHNGRSAQRALHQE
jgi:hypothetical protein